MPFYGLSKGFKGPLIQSKQKTNIEAFYNRNIYYDRYYDYLILCSMLIYTRSIYTDLRVIFDNIIVQGKLQQY